MHFFRLLHRQTKSEGDVSTLLAQPASAGVIAPVFMPLQVSLPSFDPTRDLYACATDSIRSSMDLHATHKLNAKVIDLETQLAHLQAERTTLEQDLVDYRADLLNARTELYSEMLRSARHQQRTMDDFRTIQKLEARHQRFCTLLADIGIPRSTVNAICEVIRSGNGSPEDILVNAIKDASNDDSTLLARLKPIITDKRTPEHYQSALNLTLSIRKELKSQQKRSKFWKKLAQEDHRHVNSVTPSPSDISSIRQDLSPERQSALDSLIARRRAAKCSESAEADVFGGQRRESTLETLATSLASRPRRSIQEDLRLSSSFTASSASSTSTTYLSYFSGFSRIPKDSTAETPTIPSQHPSSLSTSFRRSTRGSSQSIVLGSINLNVSRSSAIDPTLPEETEPHADPETGPQSTATHSQDLLQNTRRASQGNGHCRVPSTSSRRSAPIRSTRPSFRLSAFSPIRSGRPSGSSRGPDSDVSKDTTVDAPSFDTPGMMRLSDLAPSTDVDTPASNETMRTEDTPFNDACALPKYDIDTPFSLSDLEASTPLDGSVACKPHHGNACPHDTQFLEHLRCDLSISEPRTNARNHHDHKCSHTHTDAGTGTIPIDESKDSLFTTSVSSLSTNDTPAPTTPPTPSPSPVPDVDGCSPGNSPGSGSGKGSLGRSMLPVLAKHLRRLSLSRSSPDRERLMDKLRGLRSRSRSRSRSGSRSGTGSPPARTWRGSPARSESCRSAPLTASPSPSPIKSSSGIPVLQRRMTIRARKMSAKKG